MRAVLRVPGDKSISHRYAILAALADGASTIHGFAPGRDCRSTLACLAALGVGCTTHQDVVRIIGRGVRGLAHAEAPLDAGNSGTTLRLLAGVLSAHPFDSMLVGDASLSRRPMRRIVEPLSRMGARLETVDGHPPLSISGADLQGILFEPATPSAQVKSAVLLAGLQANTPTTVLERVGTRDHTERALETFGVVLKNGTPVHPGVTIDPHQRLQARRLEVPGDLSSAAFWAVAAAGLPGSQVEIEDVGLNPTRTGFLSLLARAGAAVEIDAHAPRSPGGEPVGRVRIRHAGLVPLVIAPDEVPAVIDELPALAALAAFGTEVSVDGAGELRVKETDRIAALVRGMRALGGEAEERIEGFTVAGRSPWTWRGGRPDADGDHRLAMTFAVAALGAAGPSTIDGADCVAVSYPGFFETLASVTVSAGR
jgi:3-phosphoshikimate 1-carboxyvinyltransferase